MSRQKKADQTTAERRRERDRRKRARERRKEENERLREGLGRAVAAELESRGYSLTDFAKMAGTSETFARAVVAGRANPSLTLLVAVERGLGWKWGEATKRAVRHGSVLR